MTVYVYESKSFLDLVFEDRLGKIEVVEEFLRNKVPSLSIYHRVKYLNLEEYEDFCYNQENEYTKTLLGEL